MTKEIQQGITECSLFVYLKSSDYFSRPYCVKEFEFANENEKRLFPIVWKNDKLVYPDKYKDLCGILHHTYNPDAINHDAEAGRCAKAVIELLNKCKN